MKQERAEKAEAEKESRGKDKELDKLKKDLASLTQEKKTLAV